MKLTKIEAIIDLLGYEEGELEKLSVNETPEGIDISFHLSKVKDRKPLVVTKPWEDVAPPPKLNTIPVTALPFESESSAKTFGEFCEKYEKEHMGNTSKKLEAGTDDDNYVQSKCRSTWKTPVPQIRARNVFFKSKPEAEKFVRLYQSDFEVPKYLSQPGNKKYTLKNNTTEDYLYSIGYKWILSFFMNGASFEVLENCEELKKNPQGKAGGHCVRIKE